MTKNINCLVDHKGAPCTCDLSMYERPMSNSTQKNEIKQIEKAIDEGFAESEKFLKGMKTPFDKSSTQNNDPIINGTWGIYQRPQHWMEKVWITRIVFKLYHRVRNWIITL